MASIFLILYVGFAIVGLYLFVEPLYALHQIGFTLAVLRENLSAPFGVLTGMNLALLGFVIWICWQAARGISRRSAVRSLAFAALAAGLIGAEFFFAVLYGPMVMDFAPATKGNLGNLRSVVSLYYGDHKGQYPKDFRDLAPQHEPSIPQAMTAQHGKRSEVQYISSDDYRSGRFGDTGGWAYVTDGPNIGTIVVNCTHTDPKGNVWTTY